jgi:putative phosphoserine phosphatase/1-acylglycerol-3-phosphate O-acyltransferase
MKDYVAFFDLDGTILNTNSGKILAHYANKTGILPSRHLINGIFLSALYKMGLMPPEKIIGRITKWFSGIEETALVDLTNQIYDQFLKRAIRKSARTEINFHKSNYGQTVLLSAAISHICQPIKEFLDMDDIICTGLEVKEGRFIGNSKGKYCFGSEKLRQAKLYCTKYGFSLEKAYFYADSKEDLPLLEKVGHPICVTPDSKLTRIAQKKGWNICIWQD